MQLLPMPCARRPFGFLKYAMVTVTLLLANAVAISGQAAAPKTNAIAAHGHWHKYVNQKHGFSVWYPDLYKPVAHTDANRCVSNEYNEVLLCLKRRDQPDAGIGILMRAGPFHLNPGTGNLLPVRHRVGHHDFYSGTYGTAGVGITDFYQLNLRGRTLEIEIPADEGAEVSDKTKTIEDKMLKSFRTF